MLENFRANVRKCNKVDCSQPLYWLHAEENSSEASAKHAGVWGAVSKRSEQEEIKAVEPFGSTY